ncbi:MAG: hypothetical protein ACYC0F_02220 [Rhodanobacter sp.]
MPKQYFCAPKAGPDPEALRRAFQICGGLATVGKCDVINIAVPAKGNLQGLIEDLIGEKAARILARDNALSLGSLTLHLVTRRVPLSYQGPVLAAWTDMKQVKEIAQSYRATDLIYLPWQDDEAVEFRALFPYTQEI